MSKPKTVNLNNSCSKCKKYPCFEGIDNCKSNFASLGCIYYNE